MQWKDICFDSIKRNREKCKFKFPAIVNWNSIKDIFELNISTYGDTLTLIFSPENHKFDSREI